MDTSLLRNNEFVGYTREGTAGYQPRPTADLPRYRSAPADALETEQARWDAAEAWAKENDRLRADRIGREEQERNTKRQEREAAETARRAEARVALEADVKRAYFMSPAATEEGWQRSKESLVDRRIEEQALAADRQARQQGAAMYRGNF